MKRINMNLLAITLLSCNLSGTAIGAAVAAKKDGVQVTAAPKKDASVLAELKKGESLEAQDREGMFWKVSTKDGKVGYVSVMSVQRQSADDSGIQGALREAALAARQNGDSTDSARTRSAVMGVRGLDESNEAAMAGNIRPDLRAVYRMEDRAVASKRVEKIEMLVAKEVENAMNKNEKERP